MSLGLAPLELESCNMCPQCSFFFMFLRKLTLKPCRPWHLMTFIKTLLSNKVRFCGAEVRILTGL